MPNSWLVIRMRKLGIVAVIAFLSLVVAPALGAGNQGVTCPYNEGCICPCPNDCMQNQEREGQSDVTPVGGNPDANSPGPAPNSGDGIPDGSGF